MSKGKVIILSGPSGAGKSTVAKAAMAERNDTCFSVSVTTRAPRSGEVHGKDYYYIDNETFDRMVDNNELLEHARYVSSSYGTPRAFVEQNISEGRNVLLDIEVQGARQVADSVPDAVKIFITPPSMDILLERLSARKTESADVIAARMNRARQEYKETDFYDYIIINDDVETAAAELNAIINAEHCKDAERRTLLSQFK